MRRSALDVATGTVEDGEAYLAKVAAEVTERGPLVKQALPEWFKLPQSLDDVGNLVGGARDGLGSLLPQGLSDDSRRLAANSLMGAGAGALAMPALGGLMGRNRRQRNNMMLGGLLGGGALGLGVPAISQFLQSNPIVSPEEKIRAFGDKPFLQQGLESLTSADAPKNIADVGLDAIKAIPGGIHDATSGLAGAAERHPDVAGAGLAGAGLLGGRKLMRGITDARQAPIGNALHGLSQIRDNKDLPFSMQERQQAMDAGQQLRSQIKDLRGFAPFRATNNLKAFNAARDANPALFDRAGSIGADARAAGTAMPKLRKPTFRMPFRGR